MNTVDTFEIQLDNTNEVVKLFKMPGSCRAYKIPRNQVTAFFSREKELKVCGVYLLLSDSSKGRKVYVGESEPVEKRIKQHLASPPFDWEEAIVFVGNGAGLLWSKGDIKYMEHGIYMKLKSGSIYEVQNGNTPQQSTVVHPNAWNNIIEEIVVLVNFLGHPKLFNSKAAKPIVTAPTATATTPGKKIPKGKANPYRGLSAVVIQALMKHLFKSRLITASDIKDFTAPRSHINYKIGSASAVTMMIDHAKHTTIFGGHVRYYHDKYSFKGKDFALTSQLYPRCVPRFLNMASKHGLSENDVASLCPDPALAMNFFAEIKAGNLK